MTKAVLLVVSMIFLVMITLLFLWDKGIIEFNKGPELIVSLDEKFKLKENQKALVENRDLEIKIKEFIYSPCSGMDCVWSGLRVTLEFTKDGETISKNFESKKDFRFVFDYKVIMIDTDYNTYIDLKVEKVD